MADAPAQPAVGAASAEVQEAFAFNFNLGGDEKAQEQPAEGEEQEYQEEEQEIDLRPGTTYTDEDGNEWLVVAEAEEVPWAPKRWGEDATESATIDDELNLVKGRVSGEQAASILGDDRAASNDLIPGVYEGGFKVWEGSLDMCRHLLSAYKISGKDLLSDPTLKSGLQGKRILELGCGHGLPGILASLAGADVHFQDYNKEVLQTLTMGNVDANARRLPPGRSRGAVRFFSGDWLHTGEFLTARGLGGHYDIILTSESIYNVDSQRRLLECIKQVLQPPHGICYVASKSYYFGVGGGTKSFTKLVKEDGIFEVTVVFKQEEPGSGNVREVLELRWPDAIVPYFL